MSQAPPPPMAVDTTFGDSGAGGAEMDMGGQEGGLQLPPVSPIGDSLRLLWGLGVRYGLATGVWYGIYRLKDMLQGVNDKKSEKKRNAQAKMWLWSFATDVGVSMLLVPGRYLTGRNCQRLLLDFALQPIGGALGKFDAFNGQRFLGYALYNLTPATEGANDYGFFLWQIPSTIATGVKLYLRMKEHRKRTKPVAVALGMGAHFFVRLMVMSLSLFLPRSEEELILATVMCTLDKTLEAFLIRNTYPWPNELDDEPAEKTA